VQFLANEKIAVFELTVQEDVVLVVDEKHYKLLPARDLDMAATLKYY
jgi:hypothetical protein